MFTDGRPCHLTRVIGFPGHCDPPIAGYLRELAAGSEAEQVIGEWMEFYNGERSHSALGGRPPREAHQGREAA